MLFSIFCVYPYTMYFLTGLFHHDRFVPYDGLGYL